MKMQSRTILQIVLASPLAIVIVWMLLPLLGELVPRKSFWTRKTPLVDPIACTSVKDGVVTLADGRSFRAAGVSKLEEVSATDYDAALVVMVAQGVVMERDLGDGRAFLTVEPKFANTCGTCGRNYGGRFGYWSGNMYKGSLSHFLICTGYARADLSEPGLTKRDRWRLTGVEEHLKLTEPLEIWRPGQSFRYETNGRGLAEVDEFLELWSNPPVE